MGKAAVLHSLYIIEHAIALVVAVRSYRIYRIYGLKGVAAATCKAIRCLPGVEWSLQKLLQRDARQAVRRLTKSASQIRRDAHRQAIRLPEDGIAVPELLARLHALKTERKSLDDNRIFDCIFTADDNSTSKHLKTLLAAFHTYSEKAGGGSHHDLMLQTAFDTFATENGLNPANPAHLPALIKFEREVVSVVATLFHADDDVVGSLNSGATEAVLLAVKAYRDLARKTRPRITEPEIVAPVTVHPAFEKAAHYFGLKVIHVPIGPDARVGVDAFEAAITPNTILLVGSAPQYPHGVIDPIPSLAELALEHDLPLHVDACFGGFMLPWLERLGHELSNIWDFRVAGVTSISADLHRYGYCLKGSGVLLYRSEAIREHQFFTYVDWPGGIYGSPSIVGTRPGGHVAAAWAALMGMGEQGYCARARIAWDVTEQLKKGIRSIPGLTLVADSEMTCLAICSRNDELDILLVGDVMEEKGWRLERQQCPSSLHLSVMCHHEDVVDKILADLQASVCAVRRLGSHAVKSKGTGSIYGVAANLPDRSILAEFVRKLYGEVYRLPVEDGAPYVAGGLQSVREEEEEDEETEDSRSQ